MPWQCQSKSNKRNRKGKTMRLEDIRNIAIIGGGTMGNGIVHVAAQTGYHVVLLDLDKKYLDRAMETISKNMDRQVKKEIMTAEAKAESLARISPTTDISRVKECQLVIEAIIEKLEPKLDLFRKLDEITPKDTILASNTSSLPITRLATVTKRPDKVVGMHFMNPVPMMKLVEMIRGVATSDETFETATELGKKMGKIPVPSQDYPGFIANRILMPMINEAVYALFEGVGTAEDIDTVMKLGMAHPMGPLALADFIGLDICLDILNVLHEGLGDPKYRPCPLLKKKVEAGYLGRKSGHGFFMYD